jgi:hypothetical protein
MRLLATAAAAALLAAASLPSPALAAVEDLPGMDTAANMKEWLKLTDDQVAKLKPVIAKRIQRVDAAMTKVEAEKEPDVMAFVEELGKARKEFDEGVKAVLTPDQLKQWGTFKAELEKDLAQSAAKKQLAELQPALKLTDDQLGKLVQPFAVATQKKLAVFRDLSDGSRISMRDKIKAKKGMEAINAELEKSMAAIVSPDQLAAYKQAKAKKKA